MRREVPLYCNPKGLLTERLKAAEMAAVMVAEYYRTQSFFELVRRVKGVMDEFQNYSTDETTGRY